MTHLAGSVVNIGGRIIQRCLVCGYKLVDLELTGKEIQRGWALGTLVEVYEREDGPTVYVQTAVTSTSTFAKPWDDCCIELVERGL